MEKLRARYQNFNICLILLIISSPLFSSASFADQLTLYFYPSPRGLSWRTPRSLAWSTLANTVAPSPFPLRHEIGHASVGIHCDSTPTSEAVDILTAMTTADDSEERRRLLSGEEGLGILFSTMAGRLQTTEEVSRDLQARFRRGAVDWLTLEVSPQACARLALYEQEYRERGYERAYGLPLRPRYGEGAGCSAFAESFIEVAGLMTEEWTREWSRQLAVPRSWVGGELTHHRVPLTRILFSPRPSGWSTPTDPHLNLFFWDPERMYSWVRKTWFAQQALPSGVYQLEKQGQALGLRIDRRSATVPDEPIWLFKQSQ